MINKKIINKKKYYTEEDMILLDEECSFIPITYDKMFKGIFRSRLDMLKLFILSQLELDIEPSECKIDEVNSEVVKLNEDEYQKTVDLYVKIDRVYVNIEINREYFRDVVKRNLLYADRLYSMLLKEGEDAGELDKRIFVQINLNAVDKLDIRREKLKYGTDRLITYGVNSEMTYNDNKIVLVKYLEYYRDLYYNKREKLGNADLWLVLFASKTFQELYNVSSLLMDRKMQYEFIRKVISMTVNKKFFEDWEIEQINKEIEYRKYNNAKEDGRIEGIKRGMEETITEFIKNMLNNNYDIDEISKITKKTEKEILEIKNKLENNKE